MQILKLSVANHASEHNFVVGVLEEIDGLLGTDFVKKNGIDKES